MVVDTQRFQRTFLLVLALTSGTAAAWTCQRSGPVIRATGAAWWRPSAHWQCSCDQAANQAQLRQVAAGWWLSTCYLLFLLQKSWCPTGRSTYFIRIPHPPQPQVDLIVAAQMFGPSLVHQCPNQARLSSSGGPIGAWGGHKDSGTSWCISASQTLGLMVWTSRGVPLFRSRLPFPSDTNSDGVRNLSRGLRIGSALCVATKDEILRAMYVAEATIAPNQTHTQNDRNSCE